MNTTHADPGWQNMVIRTRAAQCHNPVQAGPLSIRCAFGGTEIYESAGGRFAVDDTRYLVINGGDRYSSTIDSRAPVESFCVQFAPALVDDILTTLACPEDQLLDHPAPRTRQPVFFFQKLYRHDEHITPGIERMRAMLGTSQVTYGWFEDQFPLLLEGLLGVHRTECRNTSRLRAVRGGTRAELYRRLSIARDYIHASLHRPLNMNEAAAVACISYYHFLRTFRQAFGETPYKYLTRCRIERARGLLETTNSTITQICEAVGFESLGSFSWLFRRMVGSSPEHYRESVRGGTTDSQF